jgi:hypothetical protein
LVPASPGTYSGYHSLDLSLAQEFDVISVTKLLQLACIIYDIDPFEHFDAWRGSVRLRGNVEQALCAMRVNLVSSQESVVHPDSVTCCSLVNVGNLGFCKPGDGERVCLLITSLLLLSLATNYHVSWSPHCS